MKHILSFPEHHFVNNIQRPLTPLMIQTLKLACEKQKRGVLFGPQDIKGSLLTLISRGLVAGHTVERKGVKYNSWYVTALAINMLADIDVVC